MNIVSAAFKPPLGLRNPHTQNLLSSLGLRHRLLRRRTHLPERHSPERHSPERHSLERHSSDAVLDAGDGVRLTGELSVPPNTRQSPGDGSLVILIHGWEGCNQSAYMISAALSLFEAGFTVFRLNLRDHGDSHHLNEGLFNSTLLDEVLNAIADIQNRWPHARTFVAGYSLGGNFALRIGLQAPKKNLAINKVAAVCPVIDPAHTLRSLEATVFVYQHYFVRRWRRSLLKKLQHFPHYNYRDELLALNNLRGMHEFFVPRFTPFKDPDEYFDAYAIKPAMLKQLVLPTHIITSEDDPITKAEVLPTDINNSSLHIHRPRYGSHCAFLQDFQLTSWVDEQLVELFTR